MINLINPPIHLTLQLLQPGHNKLRTSIYYLTGVQCGDGPRTTDTKTVIMSVDMWSQDRGETITCSPFPWVAVALMSPPGDLRLGARRM